MQDVDSVRGACAITLIELSILLRVSIKCAEDPEGEGHGGLGASNFFHTKAKNH